MPVYHVKQSVRTGKLDEATLSERLVEADNKSSAIRHVASVTIKAEPVSIADAMRLAQSGVKVEKAGE